MNNKKTHYIIVFIALAIVTALVIGVLNPPVIGFKRITKSVAKITISPAITLKVTSTLTPTLTPTSTVTATSTSTFTVTPTITSTQLGLISPYPDAPECSDVRENHNVNEFHILWDEVRGCHYDHEHGEDPFTSEVAAAFPGFDLRELQGGVEIGHTNPSSPMENTMKHGGFKWGTTLLTPRFGEEQVRVAAAAVQYHVFGNATVELEAEHHTAVFLGKLCNTTDCGYIYTPQFQTYGQVVIPYQGTVMPFPYYSVPIYNGGSGQYLNKGCVGDVIQCRSSLQLVIDRHLNTGENWTSSITGGGVRPQGSTLFVLLFRVRDSYQLFDWNDQEYPYTFPWLCSDDGGLTFDPIGCEYNNTTSQVHEVYGTIPVGWDGLAGFDTDPASGYVTAEGFTTRFGDLNLGCFEAGVDCHPIKLIHAPIGRYGSVLVCTPGKCENVVPFEPERDIYFCNGTLCLETNFGAISSGWIGQDN